ncbi:TetR/AcrR family transcriptional regulator [Streptomyces malaysiensis]|uniref:TetR family transcriptional regulator n=1 Tax=Streptomyces malaysiensis subsp. samsunensis TaxID=459658 RepID=A0A9X2LUW0_STRMQ|nr:TetR/AcrR family transcriptional regulator [Streptomyces samsunensis]MCQ8829974.1 TetR family transcriptional regulator [Streptomyces samsunensis]
MPPTRSEARDRNRQALLSSARDLIASDGTEVSLSAIAQAAGLTTGAVYSIFGSRQNLLVELLAEDFHRYQGALAELADPELGLRAVLVGVADAWLTTYAGESAARWSFELNLALAAIRDPKLKARLGDLKLGEIADLSVLLTRRVLREDAPDRRTGEAEARIVAEAIRALLSGIAFQYAMTDQRPERAFLRSACEALAALADQDTP